MGKVRCVDCGYLALREFETGEQGTADAKFRQDGYMPTVFVTNKGDRKKYHPAPECWKFVFDLKSEMEGGEHRHGFAVASKERSCETFTQWIPGRSPREHADMEQLAQDRAWQEERLERDREWRELQADKAEQRHQQSLAEGRTQHAATLKAAEGRHWREIRILGFMVAAVLGLCTIIGAIISGLFTLAASSP